MVIPRGTASRAKPTERGHDDTAPNPIKVRLLIEHSDCELALPYAK
jgi:hypothetical protein